MVTKNKNLWKPFEYGRKILFKDFLKFVDRAKESSIVKPEIITSDDIYSENSDMIDLLNGWNESNSEFGVIKKGGRLGFYPINPKCNTFSCRVLFSDEIFAPYWGCFLYEGEKTPTFINGNYRPIQVEFPDEWSPEEEIGYKQAVTLILDKSELMKKRNIFADPSSIVSHRYGLNYKPQLGESFFVLGGIPKESVIGFGKDKPLERILKRIFG